MSKLLECPEGQGYEGYKGLSAMPWSQRLPELHTVMWGEGLADRERGGGAGSLAVSLIGTRAQEMIRS